MMNKKYFILLIVSLLVVHGVYSADSASINKTQAFDWLYQEMNSSDWDFDTDVIALSVLALGPERRYDIEGGVERLKDRNWRNDYERSLAILALYKAGVDVDDDIGELIDNQIEAQNSGSWLIQMRNTNEREASCNLDFNGDIDFRVINNTVTEGPCTGDTWVDFEQCIAFAEGVGIHESVEIQCTNAQPSLIFRDSSNEFFILDETSPFSVDNACFGSGSCECKPSLYASWVLNEVGNKSQVWTFPWMSSFCSDDDTNEYNSLLYLISNEEAFANKLKDSFGGSSWENDEYITALGLGALSKSSSSSQIVSDAKEWLAVTQRSDGSWRDDPLKTAMVLYILYSKGSSFSYVDSDNDDGSFGGFICGDGFKEVGEECELTSDCSTGEVCSSCLCVASSQNTCTVSDDCMSDDDCKSGSNGFCTSSCTCDYSCTSDSDCLGGQVCEFRRCVNPSNNDNVGGESSGSNFLGYVWFALGLIIVLGLAYLAYLKFIKNKTLGKNNKNKDQGTGPIMSRKYPTAKQAVQKPQTQPKSEPRSSNDDFLERRLDESIRKAKDLLGKK